MMEKRQAISPKEFQSCHTAEIRDHFLLDGLFVKGDAKLVCSFYDRLIIGGICPTNSISLESDLASGKDFSLAHREMGIINIGNTGTVTVDGISYTLEPKDGLYIGMGAKEVIFANNDEDSSAKFYFNSAPAHKAYPVQKIEISRAQPLRLGTAEHSNIRTIYKYIHPEGVQSCQLVMGVTILETGSLWNTMPCHTHCRRMEAYLYFEMENDAVVFHYMGEPNETRHIVVRNEQAVISPSWSIHSGVGTQKYSFIWGMAGENRIFADMDTVAMDALK